MVTSEGAAGLEGERRVPAERAAAGSGGVGEGVVEGCEGHTGDLRKRERKRERENKLQHEVHGDVSECQV